MCGSSCLQNLLTAHSTRNGMPAQQQRAVVPPMLWMTWFYHRPYFPCRCDVAALSSMAQLRVSPQAKASLHTLVVVDNPSSPHIGALQGLQDWSPNHLVRVYVQAENQV